MKLLASLVILKSAEANITCYSCVASRGADGYSLGVSDDRLVFNPQTVGLSNFELCNLNNWKRKYRRVHSHLTNFDTTRYHHLGVGSNDTSACEIFQAHAADLLNQLTYRNNILHFRVGWAWVIFNFWTIILGSQSLVCR